MFLGINTWCVHWLREAGGDVYHRDNAMLAGSSQRRIYRDRNRFQLAVELHKPVTEEGREGQGECEMKDEYSYEKR